MFSVEVSTDTSAFICNKKKIKKVGISFKKIKIWILFPIQFGFQKFEKYSKHKSRRKAP